MSSMDITFCCLNNCSLRKKCKRARLDNVILPPDTYLSWAYFEQDDNGECDYLMDRSDR